MNELDEHGSGKWQRYKDDVQLSPDGPVQAGFRHNQNNSLHNNSVLYRVSCDIRTRVYLFIYLPWYEQTITGAKRSRSKTCSKRFTKIQSNGISYIYGSHDILHWLHRPIHLHWFTSLVLPERRHAPLLRHCTAGLRLLWRYSHISATGKTPQPAALYAAKRELIGLIYWTLSALQ